MTRYDFSFECSQDDLAKMAKDGGAEVVSFNQCNLADNDLAALRSLSSLSDLTLDMCTGFSDSGLANLIGLKKLRYLNLASCPITDQALTHIAKLRNLVTLDLTNTPITDAGVKALSSLTNLEYLFMIGTRVTESGLAHVEKLTRLRELALFDLRLGDAPTRTPAVRALISKLPMLRTIGRTSVR